MAKAMREPKAMARAMRKSSAMAKRGRPRKTPPALPALEDDPESLSAKPRGKKKRQALATQQPPLKKPWRARLGPPPVPLEVTSKPTKKAGSGKAASSEPAGPSSPATAVGTWTVPPLYKDAPGTSVALHLSKQTTALKKGLAKPS